MKKITYLLLVFLILSSCFKDDLFITQIDEYHISIISPYDFSVTIPTDTITFKGKLFGDELNEKSNLKVQWISDKDGVLFNGEIDENKETSFKTSQLSQNIHNIKLQVLNEVDSKIQDEIVVYNTIKLFPIEKSNNSSLKLKWSAIDLDGFKSFKIYRAYYENQLNKQAPIFETTNPSETTFIDTTAILGREFFYQVELNGSKQIKNNYRSNVEAKVMGKFIEVDYPLLKVIRDPVKNKAYGIVNTESVWDNNKTGYGVIFINYDDELSVENRILNNVVLTDIDLHGDFLYASSLNGRIYVIDKNTKSIVRIINGCGHKIEVTANGYLFYHICPPTSGSTEFRMYNLNTHTSVPFKTTMSDAARSFNHGDFEIDDNNVIYHGESNSSSSVLSKIGTQNETFSLIKQWNSGSYQNDRITLSQGKIFWSHYLFDTELNLIGKFYNSDREEYILNASPNAKYAIGWRSLFDTESQNVIKKIPAIYDDAVFLNDKKLLLFKNENPTYEEYTSRMYLYDLK